MRLVRNTVQLVRTSDSSHHLLGTLICLYYFRPMSFWHSGIRNALPGNMNFGYLKDALWARRKGASLRAWPLLPSQTLSLRM